jgi:hypothetical protein
MDPFGARRDLAELLHRALAVRHGLNRTIEIANAVGQHAMLNRAAVTKILSCADAPFLAAQ